MLLPTRSLSVETSLRNGLRAFWAAQRTLPLFLVQRKQLMGGMTNHVLRCLSLTPRYRQKSARRPWTNAPMRLSTNLRSRRISQSGLRGTLFHSKRADSNSVWRYCATRRTAPSPSDLRLVAVGVVVAMAVVGVEDVVGAEIWNPIPNQ